MLKSPRGVAAVVAGCFLASGAAGLVYQVVWMRYLALFLGHTSYAVVAVLVAFMGGLALGNAFFGARADRTNRPLALYGLLELGIVVYAVFFPFYFSLCDSAFVALARKWNPSGGSPLFLKFLFSFALILIPAVLMGATLPVMTRFLTRSLSELRKKVGTLYAINSAGAVAGCIIADFWWIPSFGLEFSVYGAAILNFLAGIVALILSNRLGEGDFPQSKPVLTRPVAATATGSNTEEVYTGAELRVAVWAIAVSGFVAMLYEVAWTRLLALALGSSTHAFSLMLMTFISGIAVGAWIISRWKNIGNSLRALGWAELALALTVFLSMFSYHLLPYWFSQLATLLARRPEAFPLYHLFQVLICFGVMFIPTVCLGMTLPLVSRIATSEVSRTGSSVGKVFAFNTVGTVLGTIFTGLIFLPYLGLARTFALGVALNALIAFAVLARGQMNWRWWLKGIIGSAALVLVVGMLLDSTWKSAFSLGLWRSTQAIPSRKAYNELVDAQRLPYAEDGAGSSVVIASNKADQKEFLTLKINGKADAGTSRDVPTQRLLGHIPMLQRPEAAKALIVGLGSGMTAAAVARHPSIERVDVVEISPEVVDASRLFSKYNDSVHSNPRVRILVDDAKSFLKVTPDIYDVIISEPSNPWMAGVAGVFSQEYYQACRNRLRIDGLMVQWVQVYETNDDTFNLVMRTFTSVFPHVSIWNTSANDLAIVGSMQRVKPDLDAFLKRFNEPKVLEDMRRTEITSPVILLAREVVSQDNGFYIVPPEGPIHSDFFPELEFRAQEAFFVQRSASQWTAFDENFLTRPSTLFGDYLARTNLTQADIAAMCGFFLDYDVPFPNLIVSLVQRWRKDHPESTLALEMASRLPEHGEPAELEARRFADMEELLVERAAKDPEPLRVYVKMLLDAHRGQRSVYYTPNSSRLEKLLHRLIETDSAHQRVYKARLAELAWDRGDDNACIEWGTGAFDPDTATNGPITFELEPNAPAIALHRMIELSWRKGDLVQAQNLARQAVLNNYSEQTALLSMVCRKVLNPVPEAPKLPGLR